MPLTVFSNSVDDLIKKLDESIAKRGYYIQQKENKLNQLKQDLDKIADTQLQEKYKVTKDLMTEYSYFVNDSAIFYSSQCLELAHELNNNEYILDIQLTRAVLMCYPGLYHEAFTIMDSIDLTQLSDQEQANYYYTYLLVLHSQIKSLNNPYYRLKYKSLAVSYIEKYFVVANDDDPNYSLVLSYRYYQKGEFESSVDVLQQILNEPNLCPYKRASVMLYLGTVYLEMRGEAANAKIILIKASIMYNELAIMRNLALFDLATILNQEHEINRAYDYINVAMDDLRRFSDNRNLSSTQKSYTAVENAYYNKISKQQNILQLYSILLSVCLVILLIAIVYILKHNKELRKVRTKLWHLNKSLKDSNYVKEIYIGHYLNQCSFYIDRLDEYKRVIMSSIKGNGSGGVKASEINQAFDTKGDINKLLLDFDKVFLDIHPNFIEEINSLLTEENHYSLKVSEDSNPRLNAEIRILALLKLGITDNKKIASFLRFTVQTVYNYRSKAKSRAINEESFEDDIKRINTE